MGIEDTKVYRFESRGGEYNENGKLHWPHMVRINIDGRNVRRTIDELLRALEAGDDAHIVLFGKLTEEDE